MGIKTKGMVYRCPYCKALYTTSHSVAQCQGVERQNSTKKKGS